MRNKIILVAKGMAMGFADVIPGVSGGTIALIVGIYVQFIEAVKSVNFRWILPLLGWAASGFKADRRDGALRHLLSIHWGFLIPLALGIVSAFAVGSVVVPYLMEKHPVETATFFIGLVVASVAVPFGAIRHRTFGHLAIAILATVLTYLSIGAKTEPQVTWVTATDEEALSFEDFMRQHPSVRTAEQLYCPAAEGAPDNAALRAAVAADATQPVPAARLDELCAALAATRHDLVAGAELRDREHLGRKDEANPFNNLVVPPNTPVQVPLPAIWYVFVCAVIAICAMVLPGISGSFFLLVLGLYHFMLSSALKGFVLTLAAGKLPVTQGTYVIVFCLGCLVGILSFARVMSWLFAKAPSATLAALIGMMIGSLRALWPWKIGEPHTGVMNVMPPLDGSLAAPLVALLVGAAVVGVLTVVGRKLGGDEHT